jgi:hypothetical protein
LGDFFLYINNIIIINTKISPYSEISPCVEPMTMPADKLILKTGVIEAGQTSTKEATLSSFQQVSVKMLNSFIQILDLIFDLTLDPRFISGHLRNT